MKLKIHPLVLQTLYQNVLGHLLTAVGQIDEAQKRFESKFDSCINSFNNKDDLPDSEANQNKLEAKVEELTEQLKHVRVELSQNKLKEGVGELSHHLGTYKATQLKLD